MNMQQERISLVLEHLNAAVIADVGFAEVLAPDLEDFLNGLAGADIFGTEQQDDPRGDFRNGEWSMWNVEGVAC